MFKRLSSIVLCVFLFHSLHAENQTSTNVLDQFYPPINRENHFWLKTDILCFRPRENSIILTNEPTNLSYTSNITLKPYVRPHFGWDIGYRVGFGYILPSQKWDLAINLSYLQAHMKQCVNIQDETGFGMFPVWALASDILPSDWVSQAGMRWRLKINLLDIDFGRTVSWEDLFFLRLLVGIRTSLIHQKLTVNYGGGIFVNGINLTAMDSGVGYDTIFMKNNFWGIGPRLGIEPQLNIGSGFRLYTSACVDLNGGVFDITQKEVYLQNIRYNTHYSPIRARLMFDATAGFLWKTFCGKELYALSFALGWEYHQFFKQFALKKNKFCLANNNQNLSLNGLALSATVDF